MTVANSSLGGVLGNEADRLIIDTSNIQIELATELRYRSITGSGSDLTFTFPILEIHIISIICIYVVRARIFLIDRCIRVNMLLHIHRLVFILAVTHVHLLRDLQR